MPKHTSLAIYRAYGLHSGYKYQVFGNGSDERHPRPEHPAYECFLRATRTKREARQFADTYFHPDGHSRPVEVVTPR